MIKVQGKLPRELYVAVSGGVDSMAALNFLKGNHAIKAVLFFDHGTETSKEASWLVKDACSWKEIPVKMGTITRDRGRDESWEAYWREERYHFLDQFTDAPVVTCHHLDDCVETWIFSSLHGQGKIIPYRRGNIVRPFRLNRKAEFINWAKRNKVSWHEDFSNEDTRYMRNFIRHELMPKALVVNPGLHKVIARKIENEDVS